MPPTPPSSPGSQEDRVVTKPVILRSLGFREEDIPQAIPLIIQCCKELRDGDRLTTLCGPALVGAVCLVSFELTFGSDKDYSRMHQLLDNLAWYICCHQHSVDSFSQLKQKLGHCVCNLDDKFIHCLHVDPDVPSNPDANDTIQALYHAASVLLCAFISHNASFYMKRFVNQANGPSRSSRWPSSSSGFAFGDPMRLVQSTLQWQRFLNSPIPLRYALACITYAPFAYIPAILASPELLSHTLDSFSQFSSQFLRKYCSPSFDGHICESDLDTYVDFWYVLCGWRGRYREIDAMLKDPSIGLRLITILRVVVRALRNVKESRWPRGLRWVLTGGFVYTEKVAMSCRVLARLVVDIINTEREPLPVLPLPLEFLSLPSQPENSIEMQAIDACGALLGGGFCMAPECTRSISSEDDRPFRVCQGCRVARFCSPECQRVAWLYPSISHRFLCKVISAVMTKPAMHRWEQGFDVYRRHFQEAMSRRNISGNDLFAFVRCQNALTMKKIDMVDRIDPRSGED